MKFPHTLKLLAAASVAVLAACQTVPPTNPDIVAARDQVERARSDPFTARAAQLELDRAQKALRDAEAAWDKNRDTEETRHLAYLATQRARIAMAAGAQAQSEERLQQSGLERERVRLQARTQEARAAEQTALLAQTQAQLSREQADAARAQADAARSQAAAQAAKAASLEADLQAALQARNTERGMVVTLGDVLFETGRATLQPGAQRSVEQLAVVLRQYPERNVMIEGFTDSVGSDAMNLELSRRRAEAFQQALLNAGIPAERMVVKAFGEGFPVADNNTSAGRQLNRRVEVVFSDARGRFAADR